MSLDESERMSDYKLNIIRLDVGGRRFSTTKQTLTSKSTYFKARLSEHYGTFYTDEGYLFEDRDGEMFKHVLDFLRTGKVFCPKSEWKRLLEEAEYFGIDELEKILLKENEDLLEKKGNIPEDLTEYTFSGLIKVSNVQLFRFICRMSNYSIVFGTTEYLIFTWNVRTEEDYFRSRIIFIRTGYRYGHFMFEVGNDFWKRWKKSIKFGNMKEKGELESKLWEELSGRY